METMALGIFAVMALVVSACLVYYQKPFWSFASGLFAIVLTCWTGYSWKLMLISSGKDAALLGLRRYPAATMILTVLLLTAFVLMLVSILGMVRQSKGKASERSTPL